ncbi:uncharacterized protein LAJ45_08734 [Morchella importuna]|uniref:uncharacterized protein n=1 Tax=Morchella importuna TaxID=1174673 RepID=UPI001E8D2A2E|nr:uncharacterized protein LAJ45_08734 [Morchella importuna]KAH8147256.1 hypothetical protein LAJ45_08734 [Morchella importuna]
MAPPQSIAHRRTHNLLLISRLLNLRDNVSPFTLLLDSLSQSAKPLVREFVRRGLLAKCEIVFVAFETLRCPPGIGKFVKARGKTIPVLQREITAAIPAGAKTLLIIDSLNPLASSSPSSLCLFLSSLLTPTTALLSTYHLDVPLPPQKSYPETAPEALTLLKYLSTTLVTVHSIHHALLKKQHKDRSLPAPVWGLDEGTEGVVVGLGSNSTEGIVLEMEYRRRSGRGVSEMFYLPLDVTDNGVREKERVVLLEDHPEWRLSEQVRNVDDGHDQEDGMRTTFELGLTERQKRARDEVVLPYLDAQREGGGRGGAILFTPDKEIDDFDEEEDEL